MYLPFLIKCNLYSVSVIAEAVGGGGDGEGGEEEIILFFKTKGFSVLSPR